MQKLTRLLLTLALLLISLTDVALASPATTSSDNNSSGALIDLSDITIKAEQPYYRGNEVYTGTLQSVYLISNPQGITGLEETPDDLANYSVEILSQTSTSVEVRVTSELYVNTNQAFPIQASSIPDELELYLLPTDMAQSDDSTIVALANELSTGCTLEGQVVDAVISWIISHIEYDESAILNDASTVLERESATCAGFLYLAEALLRANGIPARLESGAAAPIGFSGEIEGRPHGWFEAYYPDAGWVPCDPQVSANYVDTAVIRGGFDQCGEESTTIERISFTDDTELLYSLLLSYDDVPDWAYLRGYTSSASISRWNRQPLSITPTPLFILDVDVPQGEFIGTVTSNSSYDYWRASESCSWLSISVNQGMRGDKIGITVDATGMTPGIYETALTFADGQLLEGIAWKAGPATCTLPVTLIIMEDVNEVYLPRISK